MVLLSNWPYTTKPAYSDCKEFMRATRTAYNLFKSAGVTGSSNEANNIKQVSVHLTEFDVAVRCDWYYLLIPSYCNTSRPSTTVLLICCSLLLSRSCPWKCSKFGQRHQVIYVVICVTTDALLIELHNLKLSLNVNAIMPLSKITRFRVFSKLSHWSQ